jgi:subtilisin family serine protease
MRPLFLGLALVAGASASTSAPSTVTASVSPLTRSAPQRVIVKLHERLARELESAWPDAAPAIARDAGLPPRAAHFFERHAVARLRPVFAAHARARREAAPDPWERARGRFPARARRAAALAPPDLGRIYVIELPQAASQAQLDAALGALRRDRDVEYAEDDRVAAAHFTPNDPYYSTSGSWGQAYDDLWGLKRISAGAAWDTSAGSGLVVAVIDTGVDYNHADLAGNVWTNAGEVPGNGLDDDGNGFVDDVRGWDFIGASHTAPAADNDPADGHGHGTHVAGTVAALGDNGVGVIGLAWQARVMAVKGLANTGYGLNSTLATAVVYAADNGADVINNSWGGAGTSQLVKEAFDYAAGLGAVLVASAGNDGQDAAGYYPAGFSNVITVSALGLNSIGGDWVPPWSNWGTRIDVTAPGVDVLSLRAAGTILLTPVGTYYARADGTSMAAPHVAGLCALVLQQHPAFSAEQVRQALRASATDTDVLGYDVHTGYGRIHAAQALTVSDPLEVKIQTPADGTRISGAVTLTGLARGAGLQSWLLEWGVGETPSTWATIASGTTPVDGGTLGVFDPSARNDGRYTLRLRATDASARTYEDRLQLVVDYVSLTSPTPPVTPNTAAVFKPGATVTLTGRAEGPSFQSFRVEWARGVNPASGWSAAGVTLTGGGLSPVASGVVAAWDTTGIAAADFHTLRLVVDNAGFSSEARTLVYLEPDLLSSNWPRWLDQGAPTNVGVIPALRPDGAWKLTLNTPIYLGSSIPARLRTFSVDGASYGATDLSYGSYMQSAAGEYKPVEGDEVIVKENNAVRVFRSDGTSPSLPLQGTFNFQYGLPVIADVDGNGENEVLVVGGIPFDTSARLHAWQRQEQQLGAGFPHRLDDADQDTLYRAGGPRVLVLDLDGDGAREIVTGEAPTSTTFRLRQYGPDGSPRGWPTPEITGDLRQMLAADLDRDGQAEIVVAYNDSGWTRVTVIARDGSVRPGWPASVADVQYAGPYLAVGDLDRDGRDEIVVSVRQTLMVFRDGGTPFSAAWPHVEAYRSFGPPALVDVDGNGYVEIVVGKHEYSYTPYPLLNLVSGAAASEAAASRERAGDLDLDAPGAGLVETRLHAGDGAFVARVDSDLPAPDFHTSRDNSEARLLALRPDAAVARSWRLPGANGAQSYGSTATPVAGDFDGNGTLDLAVTYQLLSGGHATGGTLLEGVITLFDTGTPYDPAAHDWPMNYHDRHNTAVRPRPENVPPTVALTAPLEGATVSLDVSVVADASDNGRLLGVQFQLDGAPLGAEDTQAPFALDWDTRTAANGAHTLTAVARDMAGNRATSAPVSVTVDNDSVPPSVALTSPAGGAGVRATVTVTAAASDNVGVAGVQFKLDGASLGAEDAAPPYEAAWDTTGAANGAHTLTAVARDAAGNATTSTPVAVTVDNLAPSVSVSSPASGALLRASVGVAANASDNVGVAGVQFKLDGADLGAEDTAPPYTLTWDTTGASDGAHTLTAVARDAAGNSAASAPVSVIVDNQAPSATITSPASGASVARTVTVTADAADNHSVTRVEFLVDGVLKATDLTAPYTYAWDTLAVADGAHTLLARAYDAAGNSGAGAAVGVTVANAIDAAVYDGALRAPRCAALASGCDSGTLLNGRGPVGPEPNQPNTVNSSCADGTSGTYHVDESNDRVRLYTLDGSPLAPGRQVRIEATVWAYSGYSSDALDLYYATNANAPAWTLVATIVPAAAGAQTLGVTYTLPAGGAALQAVRARFRYGGSAASCGTGGFNDHDDLAFAVDVPPDTTPPAVTITSPASGATVSGTISVTALASDDVGVTRVEFFVDGVLKATDTAVPWSFAWDTTTAGNGSHDLSAKAYDAANNVGTSTTVTVTVTSPPPAGAVYDAALRAPKCASIGSVCDSGTLLNGRGSVGPEPNQPNTLAGSPCADGTGGSYHSDESNDRIKVSTLDGAPFAAGKVVRVEATVWAYSGYSSDKLDLYYTSNANAPTWTFLATLSPTKAGAQTLSTTYALPAGSLQAVRARFRYSGSAASCGTGSYNDHDDLAFAVN